MSAVHPDVRRRLDVPNDVAKGPSDPREGSASQADSRARAGDRWVGRINEQTFRPPPPESSREPQPFSYAHVSRRAKWAAHHVRKFLRAEQSQRRERRTCGRNPETSTNAIVPSRLAGGAAGSVRSHSSVTAAKYGDIADRSPPRAVESTLPPHRDCDPIDKSNEGTTDSGRGRPEEGVGVEEEGVVCGVGE